MYRYRTQNPLAQYFMQYIVPKNGYRYGSDTGSDTGQMCSDTPQMCSDKPDPNAATENASCKLNKRTKTTTYYLEDPF